MNIEKIVCNFQQRYYPVGENVDCLVEATKPERKEILNIACYGGYAVGLIVNGAESVTSIDVSEQAIQNSKIIKKSIELGTYKFWKNILNIGVNEILFKKISDSEDLSLSQVDNYFVRLQAELGLYWESDIIKEIFESFYPHTKSGEDFMKVKRKIKQNKWQIQKAELLGFLKTQPENSYDAICSSSVRNFVLFRADCKDIETKYSSEEEFWEKEYNQPLFKEIYRCLRKNGRYVEAIIPRSVWGFEQKPFPENIKDKFKIETIKQGQSEYHVAIKK